MTTTSESRDGLIDRMAKAIAEAVGHGMREKCEREAKAAIAVMAASTPELNALHQRVSMLEEQRRELRGGVRRTKRALDDMTERLKERDEELERVRQHLAPLSAFATALLGDHPELGSWDGYELQEAALTAGLFTVEERTGPCAAEGCQCASEGDGWPMDCYRYTDALRHAMAFTASRQPTNKEPAHG